MSTRNPCSSAMSDDEWVFVVTLLPEDARQRQYELREVSNGLRWIVRTGANRRMMPYTLPPCYIFYQQTSLKQRELKEV